MGDVNQILERVQAGSNDRPPQSGRDGKPQQEWQPLTKQTVTVGDREGSVTVQRKGSVFGIFIANQMGRPGMLTGNAEALKGAREATLAAVNAAFDAVEAEDARFQKQRAERGAKGGNGGGPAQVRQTGKTERERQKRLNKVKG